MRFRAAFLFVSLGAFVAAQACGGDDSSTIDAPDGSTTFDASTGSDSGDQPDTSTTQDSGDPDGGTASDAGDGGATSDASDGGGSGIMLRCGDASVGDCSQCSGATQPCVYCSMTDASVLEGVCTPFHQNCYNTIPNGFEDCRCAPGDAGSCPESYQVCNPTGGGRCHTCSDQNGNNGLSCHGGTTCAYADGGCH